MLPEVRSSPAATAAVIACRTRWLRRAAAEAPEWPWSMSMTCSLLHPAAIARPQLVLPQRGFGVGEDLLDRGLADIQGHGGDARR